MELRAGTSLLHYRLADKLGEGGMGVVWRATDTTLGRDVAIKVLPDIFADDPDRAARFDREARLLASLNHPNIATVHSVHQVDGMRFLAMELVPGVEIAARVADGPLPLDETLDIARQVAEALEAAHESGVIHRDLKPSNVVITPEGRVKVLDFGLAKALDAAPVSGASNLTKSPTITSGGTRAGVILGTAAYMSPEQARGKAVDRRADIWAFGCVLYEMLTGRQAFDGETVTDILAAVVTREPDWSALPATTPRRIVALLRRCLEKDPTRRLRDAGEARIAIADVVANPVEAPGPTTAAPRGWLATARGAIPWVLLAGVLLFVFLRSRPVPVADAPLTHLSVPAPYDHMLDAGLENGAIALTRDGRVLAFCTVHDGIVRLNVRRLDSGESKELAGTDGARNPFFSPDGQWIAFTANGKLRKIPVDGGSVFDLCDAVGDRGGVWLPDGDILFAPQWSSPLMRVPGGGGPPVAVTEVDTTRDERTHRWPDVLPGGKWAVFTVGLASAPAAYEGANIDAVNLETGERRTLYKGASIARYAPPGYLVVSRQGVLFAAPLRVDDPQLTGPAVPVLDGVDGEPTSGVVHMAFGADGTLAYMPRDVAEEAADLVLVDRKGDVTRVDAPAREYIAPRISPDGKQIVAIIGPSLGRGDIWRFDIARQTLTRLTFSGDVVIGSWMPDSEHIIVIGEDRHPYIAEISAFGSGETRRLFEAPRPLGGAVPTPDASGVLFTYWGRIDQDVQLVSIRDSTVQTVVSRPGAQFHQAISPDGRWIAYASTESGASEIYVEPFLRRGGRWQVSTGGGIAPLWAPDGREVCYMNNGDSSLWSVAIEPQGTALVAGRPTRLFTFPPGRRMEFDVPPYDIMPDGEHFLALQSATPGLSRRRVDVILNFTQLLLQSGHKGASQ
ncbi:MAG TPA: protein kinase [Candidatus Krumholzibacteria bacterium]|nr:protein kinase [Candidatus Krumholzibacteria bacterium]